MNKTFFLLFSLSFFLGSCTYYLGPNHWEHSFPKGPVVVPTLITTEPLDSEERLFLISDALENYAKLGILNWSEKFEDTILNPRVIFAKLLMGEDPIYLNEEILKSSAWGTTGTSSKLNKKGDYDFSQIQWVNLLFYFKDKPEIIFPNTAQHIIDALIIDNGNKPNLKAPNIWGLIRETENHILMKETSRYLKNQWLFEKTELKDFNNEQNGMEAFLIKHLNTMYQTGFFEFNANPYISYTFEALHVLHSYTNNQEIRDLSAQIINAEHWQYALGSFQLKKYSPFRRRMNRSSITSLFEDRHGVLIRAELAKANRSILDESALSCCFDRTIITILSDYQIPLQIKTMIEEKPKTYFAKIGHGLKSSPEIYYGTPNYLISAGGLRFGQKSQISPRPSSLFLNDDALDIKECFHVENRDKLNNWNNTGVYRNLIISKEAIFIPNIYKVIKNYGDWEVFKPYLDKEIYICVLNKKGLGVLYVGDESYERILDQNSNVSSLKNNFYFGDNGKITYKLKTKKKWVITNINGKAQKRKFKKWARFDVSFE
jgi:hypothetical protein